MSDSILNVDYSQVESLTPLERHTLEEYQRLASQMVSLRDELTSLNERIDLQPAIDGAGALMGAREATSDETQKAQTSLMEQLRTLENAMSVMSTLFRSSVYKLS